jgi:hypothetical protein
MWTRLGDVPVTRRLMSGFESAIDGMCLAVMFSPPSSDRRVL